MKDFKNAHILIVDDQPINLASLKKIVSHDNEARISLAASGKEALNIIESDRPDLVLTDILMPEMDGFDLCKIIKKTAATSEIPVIFITSLNDPESIERGFDCGGIDYILKPFNPREVRSRVRAHIGLKLSTDRVKALSEWKNRLISILSHDMIGPFNNLSMFTEIFENEVGKAMPYFSDTFKKMKISLGSVSGLMENLLEWANTQLAGVVSKKEKFMVSELIDECVKAHSGYAADKKIYISSSYSGSDAISTDRHIAAIILRNLVRNAIKFTSAGGITIGAAVSDDSAIITVSDTGVGIVPAVLSNLFERRKSFATHGTMNEIGSGIGLLICKDLADRCGWSITVESEAGKGSIFTLTISPLPSDEENA